MTALYVTAGYVSLAVYWAWRLAQLIAVGLGVWALVDSLRHPAQYYLASGKRTKGFWVGVNAVGLAVAALMGWASMLGLLGVAANAVYLADVRPALQYLHPVRVRSQIRRPGDNGTSGWRR